MGEKEASEPRREGGEWVEPSKYPGQRSREREQRPKQELAQPGPGAARRPVSVSRVEGRWS